MQTDSDGRMSRRPLGGEVRAGVGFAALLLGIWGVPVLTAREAPLGGVLRSGPGRWQVHALPGVDVALQAAGRSAAPVLRLRIHKSAAERRMAAVQHPFTAPPFPPVEVVFGYTARIDPSLEVRPAVLFFDPAGGVWVSPASDTLHNGTGTGHVSLRRLRPAAFSRDLEGKPDWKKIRRVWLGFVIDGAGNVAIDIPRAVMTDQPYRPSTPEPLLPRGPVPWSVGRDPAVTAKLSSVPGALLHVEFHFPGGRHMYMVPNTTVRILDLGGFAGIRMTYRARLPRGIPGVLFLLGEKPGGQYYADPPPPPTKDWRTITIPFSAFKFARWTRDPDGKFDPDAVRVVSIGAHGTAAGPGGDGLIEVRSLEAVPESALRTPHRR